MVKIININELYIDRWVEVLLSDLKDGKLRTRLTQIESPKLDTNAEADEITDGLGARIAQLFKAKKASLAFDNSLWSLDLAAAQLGAEKKVASSTEKMIVPITEQIKIENGTVELTQTPSGVIKYVYKLVNRGVAETFTLGTGETPAEGTFIIKDKTISLPVDTEGVLYIKYSYESSNAARIDAKTSQFPEAMAFEAHVLMKDPCTKETIAGVVVSPKAQLDPTSISWDFARGSKHSCTFNFEKDYCDEINDTLFSIIVAQD